MFTNKSIFNTKSRNYKMCFEVKQHIWEHGKRFRLLAENHISPQKSLFESKLKIETLYSAHLKKKEKKM